MKKSDHKKNRILLSILIMVLIGIGEQLAIPTRLMLQEEKYSIYLNDDTKMEYLPYLQQIYIKEKLCYFTIYSNKELRNFLCEYFRKKHWDRCEK